MGPCVTDSLLKLLRVKPALNVVMRIEPDNRRLKNFADWLAGSQRMTASYCVDEKEFRLVAPNPDFCLIIAIEEIRKGIIRENG